MTQNLLGEGVSDAHMKTDLTHPLKTTKWDKFLQKERRKIKNLKKKIKKKLYPLVVDE